MRVAVIAFSDSGQRLAEGLAAGLPKAYVVAFTRCREGGLADWAATEVGRSDALVFVGSVGLAVRAIAPHVVSKLTDPAVVVVDEVGRHAIAVLSGHVGGANRLTQIVAAAVGAIPVITTATDLRGLFAVDTWAVGQGLVVANPERIKAVAGRLLAGSGIRLVCPWPIAGPAPAGVTVVTSTAADQPPCDVVIGCTALNVVLDLNTPDPLAAGRSTTQLGDHSPTHAAPNSDTPSGPEPHADAAPPLHLVPRALTIGLGCRQGVGTDEIEAAVTATLTAGAWLAAAVRQVCSIDLKAHEPGLIDFCRRHDLPLRTFSAPTLAAAPGDFTASAFVAAVTGVDNVCERAAVVGSGGRLIRTKQSFGRVTVALAWTEPQLSFEET
jgi:cobalt-precorrin 5A hydrolase